MTKWDLFLEWEDGLTYKNQSIHLIHHINRMVILINKEKASDKI